MRAVATLGLTRTVPHTRQGATTRALKSLRVQQPSCPLGNFLPSSAEMKRVGLSFPFFLPPKLCISSFFFFFSSPFLGVGNEAAPSTSNQHPQQQLCSACTQTRSLHSCHRGVRLLGLEQTCPKVTEFFQMCLV